MLQALCTGFLGKWLLVLVQWGGQKEKPRRYVGLTFWSDVE